jgi:CDP-Glycerol:Poly(glycerophosphate) glycerophosphotransferase
VPPGRSAADLRRFAARTTNYIERTARRLSRRLLLDTRAIVDPDAEAADVLIYFAEDPFRLYQLTQWLPVMERLAEQRATACVLRSAQAYPAVRASTSLPVALVPTYADLMAFHQSGKHKVVVYVNHGKLNFQSLTLRTALHVHVGHGDSDKRSSFSNQAKAYDRVFVAGEIAAQRHLDNLLEFEKRRLVQVGRPPLDFVPASVLPTVKRPTVMYAPTWEGESQDNDWSSIRHLGLPIMTQLLGLDSVRVLYKPHPRIASSADPGIAAAHAQILRKIEAARPDAGHLALQGTDLLATFSQVDSLVTDLSAVGLDYLFLRPECPIFLTDIRNDPEVLRTATPLAAGSDVVHAGNVSELGDLVASRLTADARRPDRLAVRTAYFGDLAPGGESTRRFGEEIQRLCAIRDELLAQRVRA